jgi:hypothetical protein
MEMIKKHYPIWLNVVVFILIILICFISITIRINLLSEFGFLDFLFATLSFALLFFAGRFLLGKGLFYPKPLFRIIFLAFIPFLFIIEKYLLHQLSWYFSYMTLAYYLVFLLGYQTKKVPDNIDMIVINFLNHYKAFKKITDSETDIKTLFELASITSQIFYVRNNKDLIFEFRQFSRISVFDEKERLVEYIKQLLLIILYEERLGNFSVLESIVEDKSKKISKMVDQQINAESDPIYLNVACSFVLCNPKCLEGEYVKI